MNINYADILNIKYTKKIMYFWFIVFLIIIVKILCTYKIYDITKASGIYFNENLVINIDINFSEQLITSKLVKINNDTYKFNVISISDIKYDNINYYQTITINIKNKEFENKELLELSFLSNKELVLKKIKKLIF